MDKASTTSEICIKPEDFDPSRVIVKDPVKNEFKIGEQKISTTTSAGKYLNDDGVECTLYITAPEQNCFGISYNYPMGTNEDDKVPENAKGLQICYPLTSLSTVNDPTESEQAFRNTIMALWQASVDKGREEAEKDEPGIPGVSVNSFTAAAKKGTWEKAVKVPFSRPRNKEDKKTFDLSKPESMYVKLVTTGQGPAMKALTPFYGPGDKKLNALRFADVRGKIEPCFMWEGVYYGAHGPEAPQGASLRFKLVEANYTPQTLSSLPHHRMLSKNSAPEEEGDTYPPARVPRDEEGEDTGFSAPGDDESNPVAALAATKAPKAAPAPKKEPPKAKATVVKKKAAPKASATPTKKILTKKVVPKKVVVEEPEDVEDDE